MMQMQPQIGLLEFVCTTHPLVQDWNVLVSTLITTYSHVPNTVPIRTSDFSSTEVHVTGSVVGYCFNAR